MVWETALSAAIQVAITTAGFSGVVAALGRRATGEWTQTEQLLLKMLLTASTSTLIFSFLPFVLIDLTSTEFAWRVCSGLLGSYYIAIVVIRSRQRRTVGHWVLRVSPWVFGIVHAIITVVVLGNAFLLASPSLYVLAVIWGLSVAILAFVALLLESWRTPRT